MRKSWVSAIPSNPDFYLLLNDDTLLIDDAVQKLISASHSSDKPTICIGSTADKDSGEVSYGGHRLNNKGKVQSSLVFSEKDTLPCDMGNANIMLVPKQVVQEIGILSQEYTHGIADFDYTLTAKKAGFEVVVVPGILGYCTDDHGNNWKSTGSKLSERIDYLYSPKGLAYKEYLIFIKKHFPKHRLAAISKLWLKTFFPVIWDTFKK